MKSGYFVVFGLSLWLMSLIFNREFFIHFLNLRIVSVLITLTFSCFWLAYKDNRETLIKTSRMKGFSALLASLTNKAIYAYTTAFFVVAITFIQAIQFNVTSSEAYKQLEIAIMSDTVLAKQLGEIKLVGLGNSIKFKTSRGQSELNISVFAFGEQDSATLNAKVTGQGQANWKVNYYLE